MRLQKTLLFLTLMLAAGILHARAASVDTKSVYQLKPEDPEAYYFTPDNYDISADGVRDVSDALQKAINQVKTEKNFGILFIPEGSYRISKTIYIPGAIRLIGYGKNLSLIHI